MSDPPRTKSVGARRRLLGLALTVAAVIPGASPVPLAAQETRAFSVSIENDGLALWIPPDERDDWYYTHGVRISVVEGGRSAFPKWIWRDVPGCSNSSAGACLVFRAGLGQKIFTPADLFSPVPRSRDRPYAGWLYGTAALWHVGPRRIIGVGTEVGVTGKVTLAGAAHVWFHDLLDKPRPRGWDQQLPFEVALSVLGVWVERYSIGSVESWSVSFEPGVRMSLGSLHTSAAVEGAMRIGWRAPRTVELGLGGDGPFALVRIEVGAEAVARDLFIDGSTWAVSESAEKRHHVASRGASVTLGYRRFALTFTARRTGPEFVGQPAPHSFGSFTMQFGL